MDHSDISGFLPRLRRFGEIRVFPDGLRRGSSSPSGNKSVVVVLNAAAKVAAVLARGRLLPDSSKLIAGLPTRVYRIESWLTSFLHKSESWPCDRCCRSRRTRKLFGYAGLPTESSDIPYSWTHLASPPLTKPVFDAIRETKTSSHVGKNTLES